jgi:hypothetical protein
VGKLFEDWTAARLIGTLISSAIKEKDEDMATELMDEFEQQTARPDHNCYDFMTLLYYKSQLLAMWFGSKEYAKVVEKADADLEQFDAAMKEEDTHKHWGNAQNDPTGENKARFMNLDVTGARVTHLNWKARARFEQGEKDGVLDELLAVAKKLESDKSYPDSNGYEYTRLNQLTGVYSNLASLAEDTGMKEASAEYGKLAESNAKSSQESFNRFRNKNKK